MELYSVRSCDGRTKWKYTSNGLASRKTRPRPSVDLSPKSYRL